MGIASTGNSGTVLAVLFAPPLAMKYGWTTVYGPAAMTMVLPMLVMWFAAKEPPDREEHQTFRNHIACLFEKNGWAFSLTYVITFGGFIDLASFLPTYFYDQFKVTKVEAGQLTMLATLAGSAVRVVGGYVSDHIGGINTLSTVLVGGCVSLVLCGLEGQSLVITKLLFMLCFGVLGADNGALFQLVPLRWPLSTAVAGSMIGEIGGGFIPNAMGQSKQLAGTYLWGFVAFAVLVAVMLVMLRKVQIRWTRTWVEKGGRARIEGAAHDDLDAGLRLRPGRTQGASARQEQQPAHQQRVQQQRDAERDLPQCQLVARRERRCGRYDKRARGAALQIQHQFLGCLEALRRIARDGLHHDVIAQRAAPGARNRRRRAW